MEVLDSISIPSVVAAIALCQVLERFYGYRNGKKRGGADAIRPSHGDSERDSSGDTGPTRPD